VLKGSTTNKRIIFCALLDYMLYSQEDIV